MRTLLAITGTRPELLKLAPVVRAMRRSKTLVPKVCLSGQHRELLASVLGDVDVTPDASITWPDQLDTLGAKSAHLMAELDPVVSQIKPDGIVVQGDTITAFMGALAGFYQQIPVFHVEAGLRTQDPYSPFPEEMNRRLVSRLASLHFAPTVGAKEALLNENIDPQTIIVCGNTAIDALKLYASQENATARSLLAQATPGRRRLLVTLHRRENFERVGYVTQAISTLINSRDDIEVFWILHMNATRAKVQQALADHDHVHLLEPQSYPTFVHLMRDADIILSDSGGVQEEAPALGTPVLVLRDETERPEAIEVGSATLVGCSTQLIVRTVTKLLSDPRAYAEMATPRFPFGDGHASEQIVAAIERYLGAHAHLDRVSA